QHLLGEPLRTAGQHPARELLARALERAVALGCGDHAADRPVEHLGALAAVERPAQLTRAAWSVIWRAWRAAIGAMLTWSSTPAPVGMLSTLAGCASVLFSETSAAA